MYWNRKSVDAEPASYIIGKATYLGAHNDGGTHIDSKTHNDGGYTMIAGTQ
jgi:hypothetical protein